MPRVRIFWPVLFALAAGMLLLIFLWKSHFADYNEAEPLYPYISEFGQALVKLEKDREITPSEIHQLLAEDRFERIQLYGILVPNDPTKFATIRINRSYSFDIFRDGFVSWNVDEKNLSRLYPIQPSKESPSIQNR